MSGEAVFNGRDLLTMPKDELRKIRGGDMAMIFQDPMTSLNPVFTVGSQIAEAILHITRESATRGGETRRRAARPRRRAEPPSSDSISTRTSSRAACGSAG